MYQNREERLSLLLQCISKLSESERRAVLWLLENYELAIEICKAESLSDEKRDSLMKRGVEKDDVLFQVLSLFERMINT